MSKTNCINCGHGKDPDAIKCPFCGTTYLDFTSIDISMDEPTVLVLKDPRSGSVFHMLARPTRFDVSFDYHSVECNLGLKGFGRKFFVEPDPDVDVNISFVGG